MRKVQGDGMKTSSILVGLRLAQRIMSASNERIKRWERGYPRVKDSKEWDEIEGAFAVRAKAYLLYQKYLSVAFETSENNVAIFRVFLRYAGIPFETKQEF